MTDLVLTNPWKEQNVTSIDKSDTFGIKSIELLAQKLEEAKIEIAEDDKTKEQCLVQLREWISQNGDIENCLTDDNFLLRFLRTKKYSLFMAQQMILKYLNFRNKFYRFVGDLNCQDANVLEIITNGYIFASPFRDSKGRRVIIYNVGKFDLNKFANVDMGHAHAVTYEAVIEDEETQLLGLNHIVELNGISPGLTTLFSVTDFTRFITWGEQSFPLRHKEINFIHVPTAVKYVYEYALSKVSKKLTERFKIYDSLSSLIENTDKNCLPLEMGGVMPMAEMIQLWKKELYEKRERLLSLMNVKLLSDRGIVTRKTINEHTEMEGLTGCFRKLEVD